MIGQSMGCCGKNSPFHDRRPISVLFPFLFLPRCVTLDAVGEVLDTLIQVILPDLSFIMFVAGVTGVRLNLGDVTGLA